MGAAQNIRYFLILISFFFGMAVSAGERLEFEVEQTEIKEVITVYLQDELARIVSSANASQAVLFNAHSKKLMILDHKQKTVTTIDQATLSQLASVAQGVGELARSQGGVLGDLFKTFGLDNTLGEGPNIEFKSLPGERKISGQSCQMQQVYQNKALVTELCVSEEINLAPSQSQTLEALVSFARLLVEKGQIILDQFDLPVPILPASLNEGTPIYINNHQDKTVATLVGLKALDIHKGQFSVPNSYSQTTFGF